MPVRRGVPSSSLGAASRVPWAIALVASSGKAPERRLCHLMVQGGFPCVVPPNFDGGQPYGCNRIRRAPTGVLGLALVRPRLVHAQGLSQLLALPPGRSRRARRRRPGPPLIKTPGGPGRPGEERAGGASALASAPRRDLRGRARRSPQPGGVSAERARRGWPHRPVSALGPRSVGDGAIQMKNSPNY